MNEEILPTNPAHPRFDAKLQSWPPMPARNSPKPQVIRDRELAQWKLDYWDMVCLKTEVTRLIAEIPDEPDGNE
jgi:hypothetical protein